MSDNTDLQFNPDGTLKLTAQERLDRLADRTIDLIDAQNVEVLIDPHGKLWINVEGACILRIGQVQNLQVNAGPDGKMLFTSGEPDGPLGRRVIIGTHITPVTYVNPDDQYDMVDRSE